MQKTLYIGLDVHKASISVATAEDGRDGAIRWKALARRTLVTP
jgi:transposase